MNKHLNSSNDYIWLGGEGWSAGSNGVYKPAGGWSKWILILLLRVPPASENPDQIVNLEFIFPANLQEQKEHSRPNVD